MSEAPKTIWATKTIADQNKNPHTNIYREVAQEYTLTSSVAAQLKAADELADHVQVVADWMQSNGYDNRPDIAALTAYRATKATQEGQ